jgi:cation/acetate symporter
VISKSMLLVVAVLAATVAAQKPGTILSMVAWAFSIAASAFFPALVLGIFWRRATRAGALAGMLIGLSITLYYIFRVEFDGIPWLGVSNLRMEPWFHLQSTSAGVLGVVAGFVSIVAVSLFTRHPDTGATAFLDGIRRSRQGGQ